MSPVVVVMHADAVALDRERITAHLRRTAALRAGALSILGLGLRRL